MSLTVRGIVYNDQNEVVDIVEYPDTPLSNAQQRLRRKLNKTRFGNVTVRWECIQAEGHYFWGLSHWIIT